MSTDLPMATQEPVHPDARADLEGWAEYAKEKIDGRPVVVGVEVVVVVGVGVGVVVAVRMNLWPT